jgi:DNA polymerase III subunit epsilon
MFLTGNIYKKICKLLELDRPLVIFDIETTGQNLSSDKIISLAFTKIRLDGTVKKESSLFDPEIPIEDEAFAIHGISDEVVKGQPKFREKAQEIFDDFNGCYFGGFNIMNFDLMILRREFIRIGMDFKYEPEDVIDSRSIYLYMSPPTLASAYEHYFRKSFKGTHDAVENMDVAIEILAKQLEEYSEIRDRKFINNINLTGTEDLFWDSGNKFYWINGEAYFDFSKYKDKTISQVAKEDPKFLSWVLKSNFSPETKSIVKMALNKNEKNKQD